MKATRQWGQILPGISLGLLLGAVSQLLRQQPQSAGILLTLTVIFIAAALNLMRR